MRIKNRNTEYLKMVSVNKLLPRPLELSVKQYTHFMKGQYDKNITPPQAKAMQKAIVGICEGIITETNEYVELLKNNGK